MLEGDLDSLATSSWGYAGNLRKTV